MMKKIHIRTYVRFNRPVEEYSAQLLQAALSVLAAMLLAQWTWLFIMPSPLPVPPKPETPKNELMAAIVNSHWFGSGLTGTNLIRRPVDFKLVGVFSNKKQGFAILKAANGKQRAVILHQEVMPGIYLQSIGANFIEIGSPGATQKIELEIKQAPKTTSNSNPLKLNQ